VSRGVILHERTSNHPETPVIQQACAVRRQLGSTRESYDSID
jgi:hypothetical protein